MSEFGDKEDPHHNLALIKTFGVNICTTPRTYNGKMIVASARLGVATSASRKENHINSDKVDIRTALGRANAPQG